MPESELIIKCNNIERTEINKLIDFYKQIDCNNTNKIKVFFTKTDKDTFGEVDPIFLSYLTLLLSDSPKSTFNAKFEDAAFSDRAYSLKHQLVHILYLLTYENVEISENQIVLEGNYKTKDGSVKNIKFSKGSEWLDETTGEIKTFDRPLKLASSERFIPPLFIHFSDDNDIGNIANYFDSYNAEEQSNELANLYLRKIEEVTKGKYPFNTNLSIVEIYLLRILLTEDIPHNKKSKLKTENIEYYVSYAQQLAAGLKELALNFDHSSTRKGVITARIYEKKRLEILKGDAEKNYLDNFKDTDFFLDINVVDMGAKTIRETYINNIERDEGLYANEEDGKQLDIDFEKDKKTMSNHEEFFFKDFFITNIKTDHQLNKLISRYGLQYFTHITTVRFGGFVKAVSHSENVILSSFEEKPKEKTESDLGNSYGTSYNCIIPLNNFEKHYNRVKKGEDQRKQTGPETEDNSLRSIDKYSIIKLSELPESINKNTIIAYDNIPAKRPGKYTYIYDIYCKFLSVDKKYWKNIFLLNANDFNIDNHSDWLRLFAGLKLEFENIIIYNIKNEITKNIIDLRRIHFKQEDTKQVDTFWDSNHFVLFFSYKEDNDSRNGLKRLGATLLAGDTEDEYNSINLRIWRHHYSFYKGFIIKNENEKDINFIPKSDLFSSRNLKYFELLITNKFKYGSTLTLFEQSVQYSLNKDIEKNQTTDTNNRGYKIYDTHFRLGSKIHIEDFYYAKRLFQNSFFTTPLAYLLAKNIHNYVSKQPQQLKEDPVDKKIKITLIGYENYSDFLVSTTRNLLCKKISITHATLVNGVRLTRPLKSINRNIFIIVPIASSFSTSIKIKNDIMAIFNKNGGEDILKPRELNFVDPFLNIVLVGNDKFEEDVEAKDNKLHFTNPILTHFGWKYINREKNIITIKTFQQDRNNDENNEVKDTVLQKYFIPVYTKWNRADNCKLCFPDKEQNLKITNEKCLVETGKASITPRLIIGMPKTRPNLAKIESNNDSSRKLNFKGSLLYGNLKRGKNSYLYFTRTGKLVNGKENNKKIKDWLEKIKENTFSQSDAQSKKIVLVTPSTGSKSNFIDMVNEIVFGYTANCLTISLKEDYIENSESLYADGLYKADVIIYVDDVLSTVNSFLETNYIIKYIRNKAGRGTGIDYCITLINRMSFDCEENLLLKLLPLVNDDFYSLIKIINDTKKLQNQLAKTKEEQEKININRRDIDRIIKKHENAGIRFMDAKNKLLYFTKMNNPTIEEPNNEFPLLKEAKRYNSLAATASLDSIRNLFYKKSNKLKEYSLDNIDNDTRKKIDDIVAYNNKKLFQLLVLDAIYALFIYERKSNEKEQEKYETERSSKLDKYFKIEPKKALESFKNLKNKIHSEFFETDSNKVKENRKDHEDILLQYEHNLKFVILKIICSTPLIYYKQIREAAFRWIIALLEELRNGNKDNEIIGLDNLTKEYLLDYFKFSANNYYSEFQKLKFLLKRSVQLKSNYIIHPVFFNSIKKLITLLHDNEQWLNNEKVKNDKSFLLKINNLFSTKYSPGKLLLYEYVEQLDRSSIFCKNFFSGILGKNKNIFETENANYHYPSGNNGKILFSDSNKTNFDYQFKKLKNTSMYRLTNSKELIYYLIALVQELIYEHETKAVKLEENINNLDINTAKNTINGNFLHYLRLLKLENTAAIEKFWEYYSINNQKNNCINLGKINRTLIEIYDKDPKFTAIKELVSTEGKDEENSYQSFINFFMLKAELHNWGNNCKSESSITEDDEKNKKKISVIEKQINKILKLSSLIIADENTEAFLSVNYKEKNNPKPEDIFVFDKYVNDNNKTPSKLSLNEKGNMAKSSLSFKMFEGITDKYSFPLSNFEVYKTNRKLKYRENTNLEDDFVNNTTECTFQNNGDDFNIMVVRISDFTDNPETNGNTEQRTKLHTQAVLTFYLKQEKGTHIDDKKMRMLLLLRKSLSDFISKLISSNSLIEYKGKADLSIYQKHLKHGIGNFISYEAVIIQQYERIEGKINIPYNVDDTRFELDKQYIQHGSEEFKEFRIINNSIGSQLGVSNRKFISKNIFFYEYFIDMIKTIYQSSKLGYKGIRSLNYKEEIEFKNLVKFENISLPNILISSIFPEIIINQKKYGSERSIGWKDTDTELVIEFRNKINTYGMNNKTGFGTEMCRDIEHLYSYITIDTDINTLNNEYYTIITIEKNEESCNN